MDCEVPLVEKPTHHRRGWRRRPPLAVPVPTWVGSPFAVLLTGLGSGEVHSATVQRDRAEGSCPVLDGTAEHHGASTLACRRPTTSSRQYWEYCAAATSIL